MACGVTGLLIPRVVYVLKFSCTLLGFSSPDQVLFLFCPLVRIKRSVPVASYPRGWRRQGQPGPSSHDLSRLNGPDLSLGVYFCAFCHDVRGLAEPSSGRFFSVRRAENFTALL